MISSHRRIITSVSQESFHAQVTSRFGLVLTDEAVQAIAADLGWVDDWLVTNRRRPKAAPVPKSGDIAMLLANGQPGSVLSSGVPGVPPRPPVAAVRSPGLSPGPVGTFAEGSVASCHC
jgi:hypothetical protein